MDLPSAYYPYQYYWMKLFLFFTTALVLGQSQSHAFRLRFRPPLLRPTTIRHTDGPMVWDSRHSTRTTVLESLSSLSLDTAILPRGRTFGFQKLAIIATLAILALRTIIPSVVSILRSFAFDDEDDDSNYAAAGGNDDEDRRRREGLQIVAVMKDPVTKFATVVENVICAVNAMLSAWYDELRGRLITLVRPVEAVQLDGWKVCSMKSRELLSGGLYCRYRFELGNGCTTLPLYIGQEVCIAAAHALGMREDFDLIFSPPPPPLS